MRFYQVGGAVRDKLLHQTVQDRDFVVIGGTEEEMLALGFKKVGKSFPVFLHPKTGEEYALARKEIKTGTGHGDFAFVFTPDITLEEDSLRRDFTCNALYQEEETGRIIDFHNGAEDIKKRVLRHISPHFAEDPLRVLRMCRFAARLDFSVAPETMALCQKMVKAGELRHLSRQRIWGEIEKALSCKRFSRFIRTARECGALAELLPEVESLWQIPERLDYHPEGNAGEHTILSLEAAATDDPLVNFAVLLHDIGKTATPPEKWPCHAGHAALADEIIARIATRLQVPRRFADFARFSAKNHMVAHWPCAESKEDLLDIVVWLQRAPQPDDLERFISVLAADMRGRACPLRSETAQNLARTSEALRRMYQKASAVNMRENPRFTAALAAFKAGKITSEELKGVRCRIIKDAAADI